MKVKVVCTIPPALCFYTAALRDNLTTNLTNFVCLFVVCLHKRSPRLNDTVNRAQTWPFNKTYLALWPFEKKLQNSNFSRFYGHFSRTSALALLRENWTSALPLVSQTSALPLVSQTSALPLVSQTSALLLVSQTSALPLVSQTSALPLVREP